jgi:hypothetical protein
MNLFYRHVASLLTCLSGIWGAIVAVSGKNVVVVGSQGILLYFK